MKSNKNRPTLFKVSLIVLISLIFVFQRAKAFEYKPGYNLSPILKSGNEIFNRLNTRFVPASDIQPFVSRPAGISGGNLIKIGQAIVAAGQTAAKTANYLADKLSLSLENKNSSYTAAAGQAAAAAEQAQNVAVAPPVFIDQEKIIGIFNEVIGGVRSFFGQELISIPEKKEIGPQGSLTSPQPLSPPLRILTEEQIKNLKDIGAKAAATAGQAATAAEQAAKAVFEAIKPKSETEITAEKISSVPAIDIAEEQEKLKEEVIAAKEKATNLFNQSFIEEPGRVSVWPISPAVAREQRRKAAEDIRNLFNNLGEFFTKEEIVAQPEEKTLVDEETIDLLAAKISAKLPQVQQVLKETRVEKETQTKETQVFIDEKKVQAVAATLEQLKQKQAQDRQDLFNAISLTGRINNISNVTITNPTFSAGAITDADIPDTITASNYLALSGGTLTGNFLANTASSTITNLTVVNATSTNATTTTLYVSGLAKFDGNVGIGTTSPSEQFAVANRIYVGGSGTSTIENNLQVRGQLKVGTSSTYISGTEINATENFTIRTLSDSNHLVLQSLGRVGVSSSTPWGVLSVERNGANGNMPIFVVAEQGTSSPYFIVNDLGRIGIGTTTPGSLFSVQGSALFSGNLSVANLIATGTTRFNGLTYTWPSAGGSANQALLTDGGGTLSWGQGGEVANWNKQMNFGVLTLTPTTTIPIWIKDAIYASSTLTVNGPGNFNSISATSTLNITGLSTLTGGFISSASSTIIGNFIVSGGLNASSTLTVAGASRFYSTFQADDLSTLAGGILANNASSTITNLSIINATSTNATTTSLAVTGNASTSQLIVSNSATLNTLTGNGLFTLNSGLLSTASSTFSSNLNVSGPLNASSTLLVANLSTLSGGFVSSASSTISSSLHISGNLQASSTVSLATTTITVNFASGSPAIPLTLFNTQSATNTANRLAFQISGATSTLTTSAITSQLIQNYDPGKGILAFSVLNSGLLSEAARFDSNGFLGIGTTSPWGLLSVEMDTTNPAFVVSNKGSSTPAFYIGGVNQNGNIGIGTTSPRAKLEVAGDTNVSSIYAITSDSNVVTDYLADGTHYRTAIANKPAGFDSYTKTALHMNGTDASVTFTDATALHTWTATNQAQIDTAQSKFGGAAGLFDGTTDFISTTDSTDWDFGVNDFTIDFWARHASAANLQVYFSQKGGSGYSPVMLARNNTTSKLNLYASLAGTAWDLNGVAGSTDILADTWYHIAIVRNGTAWKVYVNGTEDISTTLTGALVDNTTDFTIGANGTDGAYSVNGWIEEFRISKGIARWIANFTSPTAEHGSGEDVTRYIFRYIDGVLANEAGVLQIGDISNIDNTLAFYGGKITMPVGNVGIGTTTPGSKLSISGGVSIGTDYGVAAPSNGLIIQGNVGIGTTTPGALLAVQGTGLFTNTLTAPNIIATGTLNVTGVTTLTNASTTGMLTIGNGFISQASSTISNSLHISGAVQASSTISLGATTMANATTTSLAVTGNASTSQLVVSNSAILNTVTGNGLFTLNSGLLSTASSTFSSNLNVSGPLSASSTLLVANLSTLSGGFVSQASSTVIGNFIVTGGLNASSTLTVAGNSIFYSNVGIGTTSPGALLAVQGNALFTGTISVTGTTGTSTIGSITIGPNGRIGIGTTTPNLANFEVATRTIAFNSGADGDLGLWATSTNTFSARSHISSVTANGYVYVLGGLNGSDVRTNTAQYAKLNSDGSVGVWATSTNSFTARSVHSSVTANGYVYVLGGYDGNGATINVVQYAKLNSDGSVGSWATSTNSFTARTQHSSITANGYVYVLGGFESSGARTDTVQYAKLNSDGSIGVWATSTNAFAARSNPSSITANGYIYVLGGLEGSGARTGTAQYAKLNSDGSVGVWATSTNIFAARSHISSITANGYVYVLGGLNGSGVRTNTAQYAKLNSDGTVGSWATSTNAFAVRVTHSSVTANGYVYVLGGLDGSNTKTNTVQYASTARILVSGNLDLLGLASTTLGDVNSSDFGSVGGSIFAGNIFSAGQLQVTGNANFWNGVGINGTLSLRASTSLTQDVPIFSIQNATGTSPIMTALYNGNVGIGTSSPSSALSIEGTCIDTGAGCADYAELYTSSEPVEPGDIVGLDTANPGQVKKSKSGEIEPIGAVSSNPAIIIEGSALQLMTGSNYKNNPDKPAIALAGKIPVKVNLEGGEIKVNDPITASSIAGIGKKAAKSGKIIGYALENYGNSTSTESYEIGPHKILVFASSGYWLGLDILDATSTAPIQQTTDNSSLLAQVVDTVKAWLESMKVFIEDGLVRLKNLVAEKITTQTLCVEDVCVDKAGLQALLLNAGINSLSDTSATATSAFSASAPSADTATTSVSSSSTPLLLIGADDTEPPIITLIGESAIIIEKGISWVDPGATVMDNVNDNLGIYYKVDGVETGNSGRDLPQTAIDTNVVGNYTITYTSTDSAGNIGTATRTVNIVDPAAAVSDTPTVSDTATTTAQ